MSARDNKPHCNTRATCDTALAQAVTKIAYDLAKIEARYRIVKIAYLTQIPDPTVAAGYAKEYKRLDAQRTCLRDIAVNLLRICTPLPPRQRRLIWQAARAGYSTARAVIRRKGGGL